MSLLVSFNGLLTPYVYRVPPTHQLEQLDTHALNSHDTDTTPLHHPAPFQLRTYQNQERAYEKVRRRFYARDIMSSPVHHVELSTPLSTARALMQKFGFRHLPVLGPKGAIQGLVSDREFIGALEMTSCGDLMVKKVFVALPHTSIQDIAQIMLQEKINALPIINNEHRLVGIITQRDILTYVVDSEDFSTLA